MNYNEAYCVLCSAALDTDWIEIGSNSRSALQRQRERVTRRRQAKQRGEELGGSGSKDEKEEDNKE
jgi:hypothetical protein